VKPAEGNGPVGAAAGGEASCFTAGLGTTSGGGNKAHKEAATEDGASSARPVAVSAGGNETTRALNDGPVDEHRRPGDVARRCWQDKKIDVQGHHSAITEVLSNPVIIANDVENPSTEVAVDMEATHAAR